MMNSPGTTPDDQCADTQERSPEDFPRTARAVARLLVAFDGWRAESRKHRALKALTKAVRLCPKLVAEISVSTAVAAGFTLHKDGQEYGVFVGGERVNPVKVEP